MPKLPACLFVVSLSVVFVSLAWAQDPSQAPSQEPTQPTQPVPPVPPQDDKSSKKKTDEQPVSPVVAGTINDAPLTGATQAPLSPVSSRSYLVPGLEYYGQVDSNAYNTTGNYSWASINTLLGSLAVQKVGRASILNLDYLGGRSFSTHGGAFNSTTQELGAAGIWSRGRWDGVVANKLVYSSEAAFLGGVVPFDITEINSVAGLEQTGPVVLRNTFLPGQGVFTSFGPRLSDVAIAQVNNHISRRLFFSMVGNYNTLHFFNPGTTNSFSNLKLINSSAAGVQTGIGYQRSREDTIALIYHFDDLWDQGLPVKIRDNAVEIAYQRQMGERWSIQAGVGPEITFIHDPGLNSGPPWETRVSWTADAAYRYQFSRTTRFVLGYDHYLTNGSGVFLGSVRDGAYGTVNRELSRVWILNITGTYAHNRNLIPVTAGTNIPNAPANAAFDSFFLGAEVHRRVGRDSEFFFGYFGRYQTANYTLCPTGFCAGSNLIGHQVNFGFVWRLKPIPVG